MSDGSTINAPRVRPPAWMPAWGEKPSGLRVERILELGDMLFARQRDLVDLVELDAHPSLDVTDVVVGATSVSIMVAGGDAALRRVPIRFVLALSNGDQDEITGWQPIRNPALDTLVPVAVEPASGRLYATVL